MSYHHKSDVRIPFGAFVQKKDLTPIERLFEKKHGNEENNTLLSVLKKPKLVAWIVSHCKTPSQREKYVDELKKYIDIDIFGRCGKPVPNCGRTITSSVIYFVFTISTATILLAMIDNRHCEIALLKDYKFYLSFENNVCEDYISEKFWNALRRDIVPIVMGGYVSCFSYLNHLYRLYGCF